MDSSPSPWIFIVLVVLIVHVSERFSDLDHVVVSDFGGCPVGLGIDGLQSAEGSDLVDVVGDVPAQVEGEVLGRDERHVESELDTAVAGGTDVAVLAVIA